MSISSRLLGNVLQDFLHVVITKEIGVNIEAEEKFESKYFVPDIVIPNLENPKYIIHVTHSRTQGMTNRKFFRNLEEIFETTIKFPYAKNLNFTFGPVDPITYHDLNIECQDLLFDSSWYSAQHWNGKTIEHRYGKIIYEFVRDRICPACKSLENAEERRKKIKEILLNLNEKSEVGIAYQLFVKDVKKILKTCGTSKVIELRRLDRELSIERQKNLPYVKKHPEFFKSNITNWKRGVIKNLWLLPEERELVQKYLINNPSLDNIDKNLLKLIQHLVEDLQLAVIEVKDDKHFLKLDEEFSLVLMNVDKKFFETLEKRLLEERPTVREILRIIRNKSLLQSNYEEILAHFIENGLTSQAIESLIYKQHADQEKIRIDCIDILLSIIGISQNEMSVRVERASGVHFQGIKDSIVALISKYGPFSNIKNNNAAKKYITTLSKEIIKILEEKNISLTELEERKDKYIQRYYQDRRESTFGHQSLDPLEMAIQILLENHPKVDNFDKRYNHPSCLGEYLGKKAAYTRVQFRIRTNKGDILIKTVAAKSGASSKRKEMSSRMRIMRWTYDKNEKKFKKRNILASILVLDGEWRDEYIDLLHEAGWDYICRLESFERVLEEILSHI